MTSEKEIAFGALELRAEKDASGEVLDRISLRDHVRKVEIGAFQQERGNLQRLRFNVVVEVLPQDSPGSDDVDDIMSYDRITEAIEDELGAERINLLETLAERVADHILRSGKAVKVFVRIEKLDRGPGVLGVEIVRRRGDRAAGLDAGAEGNQAVVVYLPPEAVNLKELGNWIDRVERSGQPVVICAGLPENTGPDSDNVLSRKRIDLLAAEQAAWALAGHDRRFSVISSRTELDWAIRNGQLAVWAPSKMVFDTFTKHRLAEVNGTSLAIWIAREIGSQSVVHFDDWAGDSAENITLIKSRLSDEELPFDLGTGA